MLQEITTKFCIREYCLANSPILIAIIPLALIVAFVSFITFVKFKDKEEKKIFIKNHLVDRIVFIILRTIIFLSILIAIATPYKLIETTTEGNPKLTILADNSSSFEIFDTSIATRLKEQLEKYFPVNLRYIAHGELSPIGDGILQNIEGKDNILVISDGYNNQGSDLGDIILFSSILNSSIHTLNLKPIKKDVAITIDGPSQVIVQTENKFRVNIHNIGNLKYTLEVFVDGKQVSLDKNKEFSWRFSLGYHKIWARLRNVDEDYFEENNVYYKTVEALPRPKILFVTEKESPLKEALGSIYSLDVVSSIPEDIKKYHAVILNDINANKINNKDVDIISDYVGEKGKGLIVIGGENSFNKGNYKGSYFESILPAQVGLGKKSKGRKVNVVLVIDISESTGFGFSETSYNKKIDVEKALAINLLTSLNLEDNIGVIAFNHNAYLVSPLTKLGQTGNLSRKISSLKDTGGTLVFAGLRRAVNLLKNAQGSKNIIIISDGITQMPKDALNLAKEASQKGMRIYTIGVGENTNKKFMQDLALFGGGIYLEPNEMQKINLFLGEEEEKIEAEAMNLMILDNNHWITKNLDIDARLSGYNFVVPKPNGRKLIATNDDRAILIAGRYGLGRICILATDDGSKWAGQLLNKKNSKLITKMVNWAVGDINKNLDFDVRVKDTNIGKPTQVNVISNKKPEQKGLEFHKIDTGLYSATFIPKEVGFAKILDAIVAVNYNEEYEKLGMNPELIELVTVSGGYVFDPEDIEKIKDTIINLSRRVKIKTINYKWPFIIIAIIVFLIDILYRRIKENLSMHL